MEQKKYQTKLSAKLRRFLKDADEDTAKRINYAADSLDLAKLSLGSMLSKGGTWYAQARRLYCELSGKDWTFDAEDDLKDIPRKDAVA